MSADLDAMECAMRDLPDLLAELRGLRQDTDNQGLRIRMGEEYCRHLEQQLAAERDAAAQLADLLDLQPKAGTATTTLLRDATDAVHRLQTERDALFSTVERIQAIGAILPAARAVIEFEYDTPTDRGGRQSVLRLPDGNPWRALLAACDRVDPPLGDPYDGGEHPRMPLEALHTAIVAGMRGESRYEPEPESVPAPDLAPDSTPGAAPDSSENIPF